MDKAQIAADPYKLAVGLLMLVLVGAFVAYMQQLMKTPQELQQCRQELTACADARAELETANAELRNAVQGVSAELNSCRQDLNETHERLNKTQDYLRFCQDKLARENPIALILWYAGRTVLMINQQVFVFVLGIALGITLLKVNLFKIVLRLARKKKR